MNKWPTVPLGDIFNFVNGRGFKKSEWRESGLPILRIQNLNNPRSPFNFFSGTFDEKIRIRQGTLLFSWSGSIGTSFGPHIWQGAEGVLNQHIFKVEPKIEIDLKYAFFALKVITTDVEASVNGAVGLVHISKEKLNAFQIPLPPLKEQKRIVALLDAMFAKIAAAEEKQVQALQGELPELLEGRLRDLFVALEDEYPMEPLGEILKIARGGSPRPISDYLTNDEDGVNWIKISDASASRKYIYKTVQKIKSSGVSRSRMVYMDDFILSNSMSFGRPYIMKTDGCIHDGWLVFRDEEKRMHQDFLYYLLGSGFMYKKFSQLAAGSTVQNLNSSLVAKLEIPVPPIQVQTDIAERASVIKAMIFEAEELVKAKCDRFIELRQSILRQAFEGAL